MGNQRRGGAAGVREGCDVGTGAARKGIPGERAAWAEVRKGSGQGFGDGQ